MSSSLYYLSLFRIFNFLNNLMDKKGWKFLTLYKFKMFVRREVMNYIKENLESYSSMIKSEVGYASTNDYFSRKLRTDHQVNLNSKNLVRFIKQLVLFSLKQNGQIFFLDFLGIRWNDWDHCNLLPLRHQHSRPCFGKEI